MKSHSLHRLLASLYNKPHLISKDGFEVIAQYLHARNEGLMTFDSEEVKEVRPDFDNGSGIGVLTIRGPLTYRTSGWEAYCGGFSYEMLISHTSEMLDAGCKTIVLDCDSGGGEAYGCFEATDEFRRMCDEAGAKVYGYIDGTAASAMYGIICACDEVICNPYGRAGSIGVLIALYNDSEALKMNGYERIFVTDGAEKVPFAADGSFRESFLEDLQESVSELGDSFRAHVSKYTGLSEKELKATQARVFSAKQALELGLINKIMTRSEFVSYVAEKHKGN